MSITSNESAVTSESTSQGPANFPCPACPMRFQTMRSLNGHISRVHLHESDDSKQKDKDTLLNKIDELNDRISKMSATPTPPSYNAGVISKPITRGNLLISSKGDYEDLTCPNCGLTEFNRAIPVRRVEVPKIEKEIDMDCPYCDSTFAKREAQGDHIREHFSSYIEPPKGGKDWERLLNMKHSDGRSAAECKDCAAPIVKWTQDNRAQLQKTLGNLGYR